MLLWNYTARLLCVFSVREHCVLVPHMGLLHAFFFLQSFHLLAATDRCYTALLCKRATTAWMLLPYSGQFGMLYHFQPLPRASHEQSHIVRGSLRYTLIDIRNGISSHEKVWVCSFFDDLWMTAGGIVFLVNVFTAQ